MKLGYNYIDTYYIMIIKIDYILGVSFSFNFKLNLGYWSLVSSQWPSLFVFNSQ